MLDVHKCLALSTYVFEGLKSPQGLSYQLCGDFTKYSGKKQAYKKYWVRSLVEREQKTVNT
jgi:hypothetical protein